MSKIPVKLVHFFYFYVEYYITIKTIYFRCLHCSKAKNKHTNKKNSKYVPSFSHLQVLLNWYPKRTTKMSRLCQLVRIPHALNIQMMLWISLDISALLTPSPKQSHSSQGMISFYLVDFIVICINYILFIYLHLQFHYIY